MISYFYTSCLILAYLLSNRCDLDSDMENVVETTELSAPGADDSSDDEIYVPIIPQRYLYLDNIFNLESLRFYT